ncbi:winged helix-turn-helix transcriptional regulator [Leucobacter viscericola]|uniref:Winged helix-turn-helix transcriptional regulator n=1 Tax=Leucobacter viscericola TaxID=2714935 RepID=A0A6G7XDR9_9MICO|nr:ArsR family transcriptional regulator [Leucobacter viscericola]QIK62511.1 winged helix-turn-helix transcriptional regulator [Leucobacter viscericola]
MSLDHMSTYRTLSSLSRVQLLFVLQRQGECTADELAAEVELHHNTVREHLQRLVEDGFVLARSEDRKTRGRPKMFYSARTGHEDLDDIGERKLESAQSRADLFKRILMEQNINEPLGETVDDEITQQLEILEDHLEQVGFDPEIDHTNLEVNLFSCPFKSMVSDHQEMVCAVHLGLIDMMLAITQGPLKADQLHPFATPGVCKLHLKQVEQKRQAEQASAALPFPAVRASE